VERHCRAQNKRLVYPVLWVSDFNAGNPVVAKFSPAGPVAIAGIERALASCANVRSTFVHARDWQALQGTLLADCG
jgi:hypothetical protein